jgi:DNA-binding transcriptional LysR family regulator
MPIELRLLRCALALAEHRNFVRAAQACQVSQPSLSRSIQDIERRVGTPLFERTTAGVAPTEAGEIFLKQARDVVARSEDLGREMDLLRGLDKGDLRIGAGTYPSAMMVEGAVARLVDSHPAVRLHIKIDNREALLPLLVQHQLDIAVIVLDGKDEEPDLSIIRLNRHQAYFVVRGAHPLATSGAALTLQSILQFPVVMTSRLTGPMLKRFLVGTLADNPTSPAIKSFPTIACESIGMMKAIIAGSNAVALLPLNQVMGEVRMGRLHVLPLVLPWLQADFAVVLAAHHSLSPLGEDFVRILQEEDKTLLDFAQRAAEELFASPKQTHAKSGPSTSTK